MILEQGKLMQRDCQVQGQPRQHSKIILPWHYYPKNTILQLENKFYFPKYSSTVEKKPQLPDDPAISLLGILASKCHTLL